MRISLLHSRIDVAPRVADLDWSGVVALLSTSRSLGVSSKKYGALTRSEQGALKDGPAWIPGAVEGGRTDEKTSEVGFLVLDFDELQQRDLSRVWIQLVGLEGYAHTSASHRPATPKWRVVLPLVRPVIADGWRERWRAAVAWLGLRGRMAPDSAAKNPSRLYYLPAHLADVAPEWKHLAGKRLDIDSIPVPKKHKPRAPEVRWESDDIERQARAYLARMGPAVEGVHGDDKTYRAACVVARDFGLPESVALEVLRAWNACCEPQWSDEELASKLAHAMRYGTSPMGVKRSPYRNDGSIDGAAARAFFFGIRHKEKLTFHRARGK